MNRAILAFVGLSLVIHLVLLYAIFDIYYSSPLIVGLLAHTITSGPAPARRLVLFSADGLRARSFFDFPERSPYLHGLINKGEAAYGISHSHVPTESRPGHVAIMAGITEDVSAVAAGWSRNPVPFDSTINRSTHSWLWGSPDIVYSLADGIPHAVADCYGAEEENFWSDNASKLDEWVFDKVASFIKSSGNEQIEGDRVIFFLHLLGLDSTGHGSKPNSSRYLENIGVVNAGVKRIVETFEERFKDNRTAYLFTSDHGMTEWGSHGAGSDDETLTPFVLFGAGAKPSKIRQSLNQIDLAPLQSSLIGIAVPTNSQGILPINLLNASHTYVYQAAMGNLRQMLEQYHAKRKERKRNSLPLTFKDCPQLPLEALERVQKEIARLDQQGRYEAATTACLLWLPKIRQALLYFHRYHRGSQGAAIAALFITWNAAIYSIVTRPTARIINPITLFAPSQRLWLALGFGVCLVAYQGLGWMSYAYYLLPVYVGWLAWRLQFPFGNPQIRPFAVLMEVAKVSVMLVFAVLVVGAFVGVFLERRLLSLIFVLLAPSWFLESNRRKSEEKWRYLFAVASLTLAIFPLADTVERHSSSMLVASASLINAALILLFSLRNGERHFSARVKTKAALLLCLHLANSAIALLSPSPQCSWVQVYAWSTLPAAFLLPLLPTTDSTTSRLALEDEKLLTHMASLALPYGLMTVSYEGIFIIVYSVLLYTSAKLELAGMEMKSDERLDAPSIDSKYHLPVSNFSFTEWRRACMLLALIEMGFFGTGNIASLSSFNPDSLQNFISVFSPFTMAALLVAKIAIPFLLMALTYAYIVAKEKGSDSHGEWKLARLSALMMLLTNGMALVFFFRLQEEGSWLDIGLSISNYVISMLTACVCFMLLHVARWLLRLR